MFPCVGIISTSARIEEDKIIGLYGLSPDDIISLACRKIDMRSPYIKVDLQRHDPFVVSGTLKFEDSVGNRTFALSIYSPQKVITQHGLTFGPARIPCTCMMYYDSSFTVFYTEAQNLFGEIAAELKRIGHFEEHFELITRGIYTFSFCNPNGVWVKGNLHVYSPEEALYSAL